MKIFFLRPGFTLIEIIVTTTITLLFAGFIIPRFTTNEQESKLKKQAGELASVLELAKKKATASELIPTPATPPTYCQNFTGYRVSLASGSFSLNFGCSGVYEIVKQYAFENNISAVAGVGNFDFPPAGIGINIPINSIRLKNSAINKCLDISITGLGVVTVSDTSVGC